MQQFRRFLYSNALVCNRKKHVAFSSYLFAQQPIIWCLLMHQKGSKTAVNKAKSVIKDKAEKEDTGTENMPDRH